MTPTSITSSQCVAARALIGWSQIKLAETAQVSRKLIARFESPSQIEPSQPYLSRIIASLEQAGVLFIPEDVKLGLGPGVRLRELKPHGGGKG
jgi:predicted transcriptional regulator